MVSRLVSVDRWAAGSQAYFLTHLHSDHTNGLSSSWANGPLFCSRTTAKLFPFKFPEFNLSLIRILQIGTWHSLSLLSPCGSETHLQVMAIDAIHCPGSVMLVFRGEFGCLLYTGDFRWEATCERAMRSRDMLLGALKDQVVDIIHLDNTYCNPSYDFPPRQIAANQVVNIILSHPEHDIIIGIDTLGKEDLLHHIARVLKIKIWVWPERLRTMHLLGFHDIFTTNTSLTRVRAVPRYSFSIETLEALNKVHPTIGIMASGLPWLKTGLQMSGTHAGSFRISRSERAPWSANCEVQSDRQVGNTGPLERFHEYIYSVPYSDHSNFAELKEFVKLVRPNTLKGIVSSSSCYIEPMYYLGRHCGITQPARQLHMKHTSKGTIERVVAVSTKASTLDDEFVKSESKRRKTLKVKSSGSRSTKFSILRRRGRGAKISENDGPHNS
ncbi:5' exonuclease Apollo-like isoform X2 [Neltuma alba]|uniref:5' exonuclease Apollo-like isoform X2 n=1 Tax=Neltuma alba TaxID=207710 RepID=UPI0010A40585|nr:5' exonuclease Apollo-like isoform X2 [Prosopis alba]